MWTLRLLCTSGSDTHKNKMETITKIGKLKPRHVEGILTIQRVNLEARHLLGQNRLGQVGQNRVVDGKVAVIMIQQPDSCPLDTKMKSQAQNKHVTQLCLLLPPPVTFGCLIYSLIWH